MRAPRVHRSRWPRQQDASGCCARDLRVILVTGAAGPATGTGQLPVPVPVPVLPVPVYRYRYRSVQYHRTRYTHHASQPTSDISTQTVLDVATPSTRSRLAWRVHTFSNLQRCETPVCFKRAQEFRALRHRHTARAATGDGGARRTRQREAKAVAGSRYIFINHRYVSATFSLRARCRRS